MSLDKRVHYRRKKSWNTRSNKVKIVKTPGGKHVFQYVKKKGAIPRAPHYLGGKPLHGIKALRPSEKSRSRKTDRTVSRAFGGVLTHSLLRDRIIRAFLIEEQKIVKRVLKLKTEQAKKAAKKEKKK